MLSVEGEGGLTSTAQLVELLEKELTGLARGLGLQMEPDLRSRLEEKLVHLCMYFQIDTVPDSEICRHLELVLRRDISTLTPPRKADLRLFRGLALVAFNIGQDGAMAKRGLTRRVNSYPVRKDTAAKWWRRIRNQLAERIARDLISQHGPLLDC